MRLRDIKKLLFKAIEQEQEIRIWDRWVRLTPYMEIGSMKFVSFEDYKKALMKPKVVLSKKTSEEIITELIPIIEAHEKMMT